jgi:hypothetical protein
MNFNWQGLAELGWRATQRIGANNNAYWEWDKLSDVEKQIIQQRWRETPPDMKYKYTKMAEAVANAYVAGVTG